MALQLSEDIVSLFAVTTRDVIWYKQKVIRFFRKGGVPEAVMIEVERRKAEPTIKLCQLVVDALEGKGDEGAQVLQRLIADVAERKDLSHLKTVEEKRAALKRQSDLKSAIKEYAEKERYRKQKELEAQAERESRAKVSPIDHGKLATFRTRFDQIFVMPKRKERGDAFEILMNDIFSYYCQKSLGPFNRDGEQVDGQFYFDGHYYFVEVRWREDRASAADVSILRDRASAGFGGDVRALFISFNGFSDDCMAALEKRSSGERVILMDGADLRVVLNGDIAFDVLLDEKLARAVRAETPFVSAREIVLERVMSGG